MLRFIVCMIPHELSDYHGYIVLGVYGRNEYDAQLSAVEAMPDHYVDDCMHADCFPRFYPRMHAKFQNA